MHLELMDVCYGSRLLVGCGGRMGAKVRGGEIEEWPWFGFGVGLWFDKGWTTKSRDEGYRDPHGHRTSDVGIKDWQT